ncbi:MAG: hypothetical protein VX551_04850, partial [Pseudomonadota bacterium]|nr:hypothetical protein [Pseudomonadota bacterium]
FLQTLLLANNALAIRIIFPSVRVIQVSFNLTGLPASLGKQKRANSFATGPFKILLLQIKLL